MLPRKEAVIAAVPEGPTGGAMPALTVGVLAQLAIGLLRVCVDVPPGDLCEQGSILNTLRLAGGLGVLGNAQPYSAHNELAVMPFLPFCWKADRHVIMA